MKDGGRRARPRGHVRPGQLLLALVLLRGHSCDGETRCKIGILSLEKFGLERCDASTRVYSHGGTERSRDGTKFPATGQLESHVYGQYAAPYWLGKHLRSSEYFTEDVNDADAVFVDDYCYSVAWTAQEQSEEGYKDGFDPRAELVEGYTRLMEHPRYQENNGSALVIFSASPAWSMGSLHKLACEGYWRSMHLVVERAQRLTCADYARQDYMVVPYFSPVQVSGHHGRAPMRSTFGFFQGACEFVGWSYGKRMRAWFVTEVQKLKAPDLAVECSGRRRVSYAQAMVEMRRTVFCFLLPSDTASSRRLSDIMMAGCIPVFLGAPYHAMPLAGEIPYKDFALFFQLHAFQRNSSMGLGRDLVIHEDLAPSESATDVFQAEWWTRWDADATGAVIHAASVEDVMQQLRELPPHDISRLQRMGALVRSLFQYRRSPGTVNVAGQEMAGDLILQAICQRAQRQGTA